MTSRFRISKPSEGLRVITLLDTAAASTNLGDQIIMDAVRSEVSALCPDAHIYSVATHEQMGRHSRMLLKRSELSIVGGTSLLSSRMWFRPLWKLAPFDAWATHDITLMGVGWYQYQRRPDLYTRWLFRHVLSGRRLHSVRDGYTKKQLALIGITNVVNTGCPTLWQLGPKRCSIIPREKADSVVATLNTFMPRPEADRQLLQTLRKHYRTIYFWIPTETDYAYSKQLDPNLVYLDPSLAAFDNLLASSESLDYVGNRLHAGIRALQKGRRSIIVEIDNRAREMGRDLGLPTVGRDDITGLSAMVEGQLETKICLPEDAIAEWRRQILRPGLVGRPRTNPQPI